jgi:hypothetical protein
MSRNTCLTGRKPRLAWLAPAIVVAGCAGAVLVAGCSEYMLGTTLPKSLRGIYVPTFINKCEEPLIENDTTQAAKKAFQKDGSLRVVNPDEADLSLEVTLVEYTLEPLRYQKNSQKTTSEYRLRIKADIVVTQVKNKKVLTKTKVEGRSTFYPGGDLTSAKRTALPKTADDLAHQIVEKVVEAW